MIRKYRWLGGGDIGAEGGGGLGRNSFFTLNHEGGFGCPPPLIQIACRYFFQTP